MEDEQDSLEPAKTYSVPDERFEEELDRFDQECDAALLKLSEKKRLDSSYPQDYYKKNE